MSSQQRQRSLKSEIKVAAFRADLTKKKCKNKGIIQIHKKILSRYDLTFVQNVKIDESNLKEITEELNTGNRVYDYVISRPMGRNDEQFVFIYNSSAVELKKLTIDKDDKLFERQPFTVRITAPSLGQDFIVIGARLYYKNVEEELNSLAKVYEKVKIKWKIPVLIMGDLMAGVLSNLRLHRSDLYRSKFYWMINDYTDTTVSERNDMTHDRIIADEDMLKWVVKDSVVPFVYNKSIKLGGIEAKHVSQRFPVEATIGQKGKIETYEESYFKQKKTLDLESAFANLKIPRIDDRNVRIGAFNIQRLTPNKLKEVKKALIAIIPRYHILFVQELQCTPDEVKTFMKELNREAKQNYNWNISGQLGRSTYKERYMYIYRSDLFEVVRDYVYDDIGDKFMREPYVIQFKSEKTAVKEFAIIGCHVQPESKNSPDSVVIEMNKLVSVHADVNKKQKNEKSEIPVVMMGDFNADGSYLTNKEEAQLKLKRDKGYRWLLEDVDTTVGKNTNNYDRIIVHGKEWDGNIRSPKAYQFDKVLKLSYDVANSVSDHYPVEFTLDLKSRKRKHQASRSSMQLRNKIQKVHENS